MITRQENWYVHPIRAPPLLTCLSGCEQRLDKGCLFWYPVLAQPPHFPAHARICMHACLKFPQYHLATSRMHLSTCTMARLEYLHTCLNFLQHSCQFSMLSFICSACCSFVYSTCHSFSFPYTMFIRGARIILFNICTYVVHLRDD